MNVVVVQSDTGLSAIVIGLYSHRSIWHSLNEPNTRDTPAACISATVASSGTIWVSSWMRNFSNSLGGAMRGPRRSRSARCPHRS